LVLLKYKTGSVEGKKSIVKRSTEPLRDLHEQKNSKGEEGLKLPEKQPRSKCSPKVTTDHYKTPLMPHLYLERSSVLYKSRYSTGIKTLHATSH